MSIDWEPLDSESAVLTIHGRLDQTQSPELEEVLASLMGQGRIRLIVDLSQVTYVNSGGLRCLVTGWRKANALGGDVVLCQLAQRVKQVFAIVGFDNVFTIYSDCGSARRTLQEP